MIVQTFMLNSVLNPSRPRRLLSDLFLEGLTIIVLSTILVLVFFIPQHIPDILTRHFLMKRMLVMAEVLQRFCWIK